MHERVTWEIVTPRKTNVNLVFDSVDIGYLGVTISHVSLSCSQYLYNALMILNHEKVEYICNGLCTLKELVIIFLHFSL